MVSSYSSGLSGSLNDWDRAKIKAFELVDSQFGTKPYNCQDLDKQIKKIQEAIINAYKTPLVFDERANISLYQRAYKEELERRKFVFESMFSTKGCRDIFENIRLTTGAVKETEYAIKSEQQVLGKSTKDQNIYIGIGAVVMLIGLYIVLKK